MQAEREAQQRVCVRWGLAARTELGSEERLESLRSAVPRAEPCGQLGSVATVPLKQPLGLRQGGSWATLEASEHLVGHGIVWGPLSCWEGSQGPGVVGSSLRTPPLL